MKKEKARIYILVLLFSVTVVIGSMFTTTVHALNRDATINGVSRVYVGNTFTVILGFKQKAPTRAFSFRTVTQHLIQLLSCDNPLAQAYP